MAHKEAESKVITLNQSVLSGQAPAAYAQAEGQFLSSYGIDPEYPVGSQVKASGLIVPTRFEKFSSTAFSGSGMWILTSPKDSKVYSYLDNGYLVRYDDVLTNETSIGRATSGAGNGAAYYNNYYYLFTPTDVSRYGPLDNSPSLANAWWTSTLSLTALTNNSTPGDHGANFPNHAPHEHYGKLYFCDFKNGQGYIHFIQTSKVTNEGDTNNGSTYNTTFIMPFGYFPMDIESYGGDLIILASPISSNTTLKKGKAVIFFWDTFSTKPYRKIDLPDSLATALLTHNGVPYIWSGEIGRGVRLSRYIGGNQLEGDEYFQEGTPPFAGAVDSFGDRIVWGGYTTIPSAAAGIYAKGYNSPDLPKEAINQIGRHTGTGTIPTVTALKFSQSTNKYPLMAWTDNSDTLPQAYGIDKLSGTATFNSSFRTEMVKVGQPFQITKIRFPLGQSVVANMSVTPKVFIDDDYSSTTLNTINTTNDNALFNATRYNLINGKHNFFIQLDFAGTVALPIGLPIEVTLTLLGD